MNTIFLICGGIVLVGIFIFLFLVFKAKKKHKAIKHYEDIRDSLTIREQKEEEKKLDYENYSGFNLGNIIGGFLTLFVGFTMLGVINDELANVSSNVTIVSETVVGLANLVPVFFVIAIIGTALGMVSMAFRRSGLI